MTGERMETVREALEDAPCECYEVPTLVAADPGMAREVVCARCRALAEVERWERDRARLERQLAEAIAQDYCTICGAALGEGQDSDLAERGKWAALCPACKGYPDQSHTNDENCLANQDQRVGWVGECPCDGGDRGCVCG